jgi:membrane protein DedA with SNARE-associated domain
VTVDRAIQLFQTYGVAGIAVLVFAKRMGVPLPAMPFLLLAGARGAQEPLFALRAAAAACITCVMADQLWFAGGRRFGRRMLVLMCKLSIAPNTCIRRSELAFEDHGALTILLAKFIPGIAGLAPSLAGALRMPTWRFAALNSSGTVAWVAAGVGAGWLLNVQVWQVIGAMTALGSFGAPVVVVGLVAYLASLVIRRARVSRATTVRR